MKISKEELIEEISAQLEGLSSIAEAYVGLEIEHTLALLDLQFRLKSKLYELTNEQEN